MSTNPYSKYRSSPIWKTVEKAVADLVKNGDLSEMTSRGLIVGYITKQVVENQEALPRRQVLALIRQKSKELETAIGEPRRQAV